MKIQGKITSIKNAILSDIRNGALLPGSKIPSRAACMSRFGCARASVDRAVNELISDGVLSARQGAGTYVMHNRRPVHELTRLYVINPGGVSAAYFEPDSIEFALNRILPVVPVEQKKVGSMLNRIARPGNAVIWKYPGYRMLPFLDYLDNSNIPLLMIGRSFEPYNFITVDSANGIAAGMDFLLADGANEVAFLHSEPVLKRPYVMERQLQFYGTAVAKGVTIPPQWSFCCSREEDMHKDIRQAAKLLFPEKNSGKKAARAIYLEYSNWYDILVQEGKKKGYEPGRDYRILVFDVPSDGKLWPGSCAVYQNYSQTAEIIAEFIAAGGAISVKKKLEPELIYKEK